MKLKVKIFNFNNERYNLIVLPTWVQKISWCFMGTTCVTFNNPASKVFIEFVVLFLKNCPQI